MFSSPLIAMAELLDNVIDEVSVSCPLSNLGATNKIDTQAQTHIS